MNKDISPVRDTLIEPTREGAPPTLPPITNETGTPLPIEIAKGKPRGLLLGIPPFPGRQFDLYTAPLPLRLQPKKPGVSRIPGK